MRKLAKYLKPYSGWIVLTILLVFIHAMVDLKLPEYMSRIVDVGIAGGDIPYILQVGMKMILVALIGVVCAIGAGYLAAKVATGFSRDLRDRVFVKVESFNMEEFKGFTVASLITRITNDIQQVQMVLVLLLRVVMLAPIMGIGAIIKIIETSADMAWVMLVSVPMLLLVVAVLSTKVMPKFKLLQKLVDRLNAVSRENLTGLRVIRAFNTQKIQEEKFDDVNKDLTSLNIFVNRVMAIMQPAIMLIFNLTTVAVVWLGASRIQGGTLEVGSLMAFIQYATQIMMSFMVVSMIFIMIPRASVSAYRIAEVLECPNTILDKEEGCEPIFTSRGKVEFKDVGFCYADSDAPVLEHITFTAQPGETVAIIGSTGSGKSTLINLIPRFFDATTGAVEIDGVNVKDMPQRVLRQKIGYIPQKALLFSGTIGENIGYGAKDASAEELYQAAKVAQAVEFIDSKPEGLDAPVAQSGSNLSGGQKQRLAIARALAKQPEILIFDDSFSALDFKTDRALRQELKTAAAGITSIIVAQRISTIMDADQIIVLDEGEIVGQGKHRDLLAGCQVYQEIAHSQLSQEELA